MAIRLEAHFSALQLSDITVADSPSVSTLRLEVQAPALQFTDVTLVERAKIPLIATALVQASVRFKYMAMAEAVYQKMVAAGIWTDADTKNRTIADTITALELVSLGLTKALGDASVAEDALVHRVTKGLFDTVAQAETFKFELGQSFTEHTTAHEEFQFDLIHSESDTIVAQDIPRLSVEKWFADSVSTEDTTVVAKIFFLDFIETLLADDESGFRMLMNRGRDEDATNTADLSNWSIGKFASDVITEVRDAHTFELAKALEESITPTEQFVKNISRPVADTFGNQDSSSFVLSSAKTDTATVPDSSTFELTSAKTDSAVSSDAVSTQSSFSRAMTDALVSSDLLHTAVSQAKSDDFTVSDVWHVQLDATKADNASTQDSSNLTLFWNFIDTVALAETIRVDEPQFIGESLGTQDSATIVHIRGGSAILNNMQLNQSTLG